MAKLQLKILTAETVKFDEPVDMVIVRSIVAEMGRRSAVGDMGILPGHMALSAVLGISPLRIMDSGTERVLAVFGGLINVRDNVVTVMTEKALWPDEIDEAKAREEHDRAQQAREALSDDTDLRSNQIAMRRALVQMEVSTYPLVGRK